MNWFGNIRVSDLEMVKDALLREGFVDAGLLQIQKPGQVFGFVKRIDGRYEVHVRGYIDNTLDDELEVSREYLEHLFYGSQPCYETLIEILNKYDIPYELVKPIPPCLESPQPRTLTPWKPIAIGLTIIGAVGIALYLINSYFSPKEK